MPAEIVLAAANLKAAVEMIVARGGSEPREADLVAGNLVESNLAGHDSHGVGMIPRYVNALLEGELVANVHLEVKLDSGALLRLDGHRGYGQAIGEEAMSLGIDRARAHGVCVVALGNTHHLGRIGRWAERCLAAGFVSLHFVNVIARPSVAPWGGRDGRHGTNPVCIGIPRTGGEPFVLDFATGRIAQGKARIAHHQRQLLPQGMLLDDRGEPTTDPRYAVIPPFGAILPFGEHKGYGLAVACELLGGALAGGRTRHTPFDGKQRVLNGMLSILIDPGRLGAADAFMRESEAFIAWLLQSRPASGTDRVKLAGDPERENRRRRLAGGVPIDPVTWEEILAAAGKLGLSRAEVERRAGL